MEYRIFILSSGQKAPAGSTGVVLPSCGGMMWIGPVGSFPDTAILGKRLKTDPVFESKYNHRLATEEEINEYDDILANPPEDPHEME